MPKMTNLDMKQLEKAKIMNDLKQAIDSGNEQDFKQAFEDFLNYTEQKVLQEAQSMQEANDVNVLSSRGIRQLTSQENKYFQKVVEAMKSSNPKQALTELDITMPETIFESVFEDLKANHPLLEAIGFQNTSGLIEFITNKHGQQVAAWGKLTDAISKELTSGFKKMNLTLDKLTAFLPIPKSMLDLGASWIDKYIREVLYEAIALGLEIGIVTGSGADMPIGMIRQVGDGVAVIDGVHPEKETVLMEALDPITYGTLITKLVKTPNGNTRPVTEVLMIVNPVDYFTKIMPATTIRRTDGTYANNVFPYPTNLIQSVAVPEGKAIMGIAKKYFMGIGTAKSGKIEYSDEYRFLEDERVYLIKLYGHGEPLDNNAFLYLDISDLEPAYHKIFIANASDEPVPIYETTDARIESLTIGTLDLSPEFNKSHFVYTASTDNATNNIKAVPCDDTATVEIKVNDVVVTNDTSATWNDGDNTVVIKVDSGAKSETYNITVTKTVT